MALPKIDIVKELKKLYQEGYIKSKRSSDTGIGYTLESLLGIPENNSGEPDFDYNGLLVELKSQREETASKITLMTKTPHWNPLKAKEIIEMFGYKDKKNRQALKITLTANNFNAQGFRLEVDRRNNRLNIVQKDYGVACYFVLTELMEKLREKLYGNLVLVFADTKKSGGKEYFRYKKAILLQDLSEDAFEALFDDGSIVWEFRMHIKDDGGVRDHGPGFRISRNQIEKLYARSAILFDASRFSEEQK